MKQAFVVKKPKWVPFTEASEEFKKASDNDNAVLVVRGRSKEKGKANKLKEGHGKQKPDSTDALAADLRKSGTKPEEIEKAVKAFKVPTAVKAAAAMILAMFCFAFGANAQQSILNNLTSSTVAGVSTNYGVWNGSPIGWNINQVAAFQLSVLGTNATTGVLKINLDFSDNGTDWVTNQFTLTTTAQGTTAGTSITLLTNTVGGKYCRVGSTVNTNAAALTIPRLTVSLKDY